LKDSSLFTAIQARIYGQRGEAAPKTQFLPSRPVPHVHLTPAVSIGPSHNVV